MIKYEWVILVARKRERRERKKERKKEKIDLDIALCELVLRDTLSIHHNGWVVDLLGFFLQYSHLTTERREGHHDLIQNLKRKPRKAKAKKDRRTNNCHTISKEDPPTFEHIKSQHFHLSNLVVCCDELIDRALLKRLQSKIHRLHTRIIRVLNIVLQVLLYTFKLHRILVHEGLKSLKFFLHRHSFWSNIFLQKAIESKVLVKKNKMREVTLGRSIIEGVEGPA